MRASFPIILASSVVVQIACQAFKVLLYSVRDRKLRLSYFISAGGMPSAHSAFVTALTVSVGLWNGLGSDLLAVSAVFSLIIIYDAFRLRGTVQHHAQVLKKLLSRHPEVDAGEITEMVGHSLGEIAAGILVGGAFAVLVYLAASAIL
jgi:hypothetical protein